MTREPAIFTGYDDIVATPFVIVSALGSADDATAAVGLVGGRVLERIGWCDVDKAIGRHVARPVLLLETDGVPEAVLSSALAIIDDRAAALQLPIVVALSAAQIDPVSAWLLRPDVQLLCAPTMTDRIVALTVAARGAEALVLHDTWRENEATRLRRLHAEVARVAEILTQLAQDDHAADDDAGGIADRRRDFDAGPVDHDAVEARDVRRTIRARRLRDQFLGEGMFEDPAWDMLLDLYAAELERTRVSVSSLCIAAAVAPTTALRWIAKLTESGLLIRHPDPTDRRRAFIALSAKTSDAMRRYMLAVAQA